MPSRGTRPERNVGRNFAGEPRDFLSAKHSLEISRPSVCQWISDLLINHRYVLEALPLSLSLSV